MIKINIVAVGKVKEKYFSCGIEEYAKRLSRFCNFKITEIKEENFTTEPNSAEKAKILFTEGQAILKELKGYVIALAIEGQKYNSEKFALKIKEISDKRGEITFVIGGSYGLDNAVKKKADELISVSDMTFPHTLFRLLLTEQIYRAFMINAGSGYHK